MSKISNVTLFQELDMISNLDLKSTRGNIGSFGLNR